MLFGDTAPLQYCEKPLWLASFRNPLFMFLSRHEGRSKASLPAALLLLSPSPFSPSSGPGLILLRFPCSTVLSSIQDREVVLLGQRCHYCPRRRLSSPGSVAPLVPFSRVYSPDCWERTGALHVTCSPSFPSSLFVSKS